MINFDDYANEYIIEHNSKWPYIPDHPYRILIIGGSGSRKTNALLNLINNQPDIDKIYLYAKDPYEAKYQYLINKREKVGLDHFDDHFDLIFNARDMAIKFIEDYGSMIFETKRLARHEGTGFKILTPNQMLKRLPIALAQIKAGNNSESLLNEIRQNVYSLYRSKEITKKVYHNIINSIKV